MDPSTVIGIGILLAENFDAIGYRVTQIAVYWVQRSDPDTGASVSGSESGSPL